MAEKSQPDAKTREGRGTVRPQVPPEVGSEPRIASRKRRQKKLETRGNQHDYRRRQRPTQGVPRQEKPAVQEHQQGRAFREAAAQIIKNFPARNVAERVARLFPKIV